MAIGVTTLIKMLDVYTAVVCILQWVSEHGNKIQQSLPFRII